MKSSQLIVLASAALFACTALPAMALDLSAGGISVSSGSTDSGGTSISTGTGGTSATTTLGGGSNIATVGGSTGGTGGSLAIGSTSGNLVSLNGTDGSVNLGGVGAGTVSNTLNGVTGPLGTTLDGVNPGGLPGTGGVLPGGGGNVQVAAAFSNLSPLDQRRIKVKCRSVLASPSSFSAQTVALCRIAAGL